MKTALHAQKKDTRNLFRAIPVNNEAEIERKQKEEWAELERLVAKGHKHFWSKRTQGKPPKVSKTHFNCFDTLY